MKPVYVDSILYYYVNMDYVGLTFTSIVKWFLVYRQAVSSLKICVCVSKIIILYYLALKLNKKKSSFIDLRTEEEKYRIFLSTANCCGGHHIMAHTILFFDVIRCGVLFILLLVTKKENTVDNRHWLRILYGSEHHIQIFAITGQHIRN